MARFSKESTLNRVSNRFRQVSWKDRGLLSLAAIIVAAAAAWRLDGDPLTVAAVSVGSIVIINLMLLFLPWALVGIVWALNLITLPISAGLYGLATSIDTGALDNTTYAFGLISLFASSVLLTFFAYKYAPGRLWLNLLAIFFIQNFFSAVVLAYFAEETNTNISSIGVFFGIILAVIYLVARIIISRKREILMLDTVDKRSMKRMQDKLESSFKDNQRVKIFVNDNASDERILPNFAVVTPNSVSLIYARSGDQQSIGIDNKDRLHYKGASLDDLATTILLSAKKIARQINRPEINIIISAPRLLTLNKPATMTILTREGKELGDVSFVNMAPLPTLIKKLPIGDKLSRDQQDNILVLFSVDEEEAKVKAHESKEPLEIKDSVE